MKSKLWMWMTLGLLAAFALSACSRGRFQNPATQPPAENSSPAAPLPSATSVPQIAPTQAPTLAPSSPTAAPAQAQPTLQPAASSSDVSQTANDLTNLLDGLTKTLDSTDTLNDVK